MSLPLTIIPNLLENHLPLAEPYTIIETTIMENQEIAQSELMLLAQKLRTDHYEKSDLRLAAWVLKLEPNWTYSAWLWDAIKREIDEAVNFFRQTSNASSKVSSESIK